MGLSMVTTTSTLHPLPLIFRDHHRLAFAPSMTHPLGRQMDLVLPQSLLLLQIQLPVYHLPDSRFSRQSKAWVPRGVQVGRLAPPVPPSLTKHATVPLLPLPEQVVAIHQNELLHW